MQPSSSTTAALRVARFLASGPARLAPAAAAASGCVLLDGGERGSIGIQREVLKAMLGAGQLRVSLDMVALTEAGEAFSRRQVADGFLAQHRDLEHAMIDLGTGAEQVTVNMAESPLAQLARRKDKAGNPFLDEREFRAGERLRSDYTRGQIMPRLGANWVASVASGRRGGRGGVADLTDAALAARQRVERAMDAVGPELQGVLVDICCFLKGLEQVETERGWPVRSAKIVLKTALGTLARHYEPVGKPERRRLLHWGTGDYRPSL